MNSDFWSFSFLVCLKGAATVTGRLTGRHP